MTASDREIVTTRVVAGPKGFTNTFQEFDLRPGGRWPFVVHGPNGCRLSEPERETVVDPKNLFRLNQNIVPAA